MEIQDQIKWPKKSLRQDRMRIQVDFHRKWKCPASSELVKRRCSACDCTAAWWKLESMWRLESYMHVVSLRCFHLPLKFLPSISSNTCSVSLMCAVSPPEMMEGSDPSRIPPISWSRFPENYSIICSHPGSGTTQIYDFHRFMKWDNSKLIFETIVDLSLLSFEVSATLKHQNTAWIKITWKCVSQNTQRSRPFIYACHIESDASIYLDSSGSE